MPGLSRRARLEGRVALVSGASGGIGSALARALGARGMRLALLARRGEALEALAAGLAAAGTSATVHPCDVTDRDATRRAVQAAAKAHGRLDLVATCAGVGYHGSFGEHSPEQIEALLRVNLHGVVHVLQATLPHLEAAGGGFVVNVSSVAGRLAQPDEAVYSASKFAVTGLSEALAIELAPSGIHVLTVHPGLVRTGFVPAAQLARVPESVRRRAIAPEVVAAAILAALDRRRHEVTVPGYAAGGYLLHALAPGLFRRILTRVRGGALPELRRPRRA
jgi:short-subunit dehydrogenase